MKSKLFAILFVLLPMAVCGAEIASVNFKAIEDDLREYYLAKPEHVGLKKQFAEAVESEKKFQESIQEKMKGGGGKPLDIGAFMPPKGATDRFELERKIEAELRKELYRIVSGLGLKYELIYDTSSEGAIIYAKSQVDDLTTTVRQAIIDLGKKK